MSARRGRCAILPSFRAALRDGTVGVDQVDEVARLHANPRCGRQVAGSEEILLDAARQLEYADFAVVTQRWLTLADPDGAHRDVGVYARESRACTCNAHVFVGKLQHASRFCSELDGNCR